ncbi:MAG: hypothetical protein ACXW02_06300, partial [Halobacteriota archaeon]
ASIPVTWYQYRESFINMGGTMLTFRQKLGLQKIVIEQNKILAGAPAPEEKMEAERIKREALAKLVTTLKTNLK